MKLIAKKAGNGYISSYTLNISLKIAKQCGFIKEDGTPYDVELQEKPDDKQIIIKPIISENN